MKLFEDLLRASTPVIVLVEPDLAWAELYVLEKARLVGASDKILEYRATRGWDGSESLMHVSGLSTITNPKLQSDPIVYLSQFGSWLRGFFKNRPLVPEESPFFKGVAILHDLYREIDSPTFVRQIVELGQDLAMHSATAVLIVPTALDRTHPLFAVSVQVWPEEFDEGRHAPLVRGFARDLESIVGNVDVVSIARLLDDETLARAEAVLRLAALRLFEADEQGREKPHDLVTFVRELKNLLNYPSKI